MKELKFNNGFDRVFTINEEYGDFASIRIQNTISDREYVGATLVRSDAIKVGRFLLNLFGAPLEEPKPEPKVGQIWKGQQSKDLVLVVDVDMTRIEVMFKNGVRCFFYGLDGFEFVSESWAEEKTE